MKAEVCIDILGMFNCPVKKKGFKIFENRCYYFEKETSENNFRGRNYDNAKKFCKTAFGSTVVGKLIEPKSLSIMNLIREEMNANFGVDEEKKAFIWMGR